MKQKPKRKGAVLALVLAAVLLLACLGLLLFGREGSSAASGGALGQALGRTGTGGGPGYGDVLVYQPESPARGDSPNEGFMGGVDAFSCQTAALLLAGGEGNGNYSPVSLYFALAALTNGAEGETLNDLLALLGVESLDALNQNSALLLGRLQRESETHTLDIANSLWLDKEFDFDADYVQTVADNLNAWLFEVDFAGGEADAYSAEWVKDKTRGTLAPTFEAEPETVLRILNTVYFKGNWRSEFWEGHTAEEAFTLQNGEEVQADFMKLHYSESYYVQGEGYLGYSKALYGATMNFILPDEGVSVDNLLADPARLGEALGNKERLPAEVIFWTPKFAFTSSYELTGTLEQLGLGQLMQENAGLTGMAENGQDMLVNKALQETYITIDEVGVEAAAYTTIEGEPAEAAPEEEPEPLPLVEIKLTRPFIYTITGSDGALLFIGVVRDPSV